jgi:lactobin A/cerein 7B family class IIb bacteriocin
MKNIDKLEIIELTKNQMEETEGGFYALIIAGVGACLAAYAAGYVTGKAIFQ